MQKISPLFLLLLAATLFPQLPLIVNAQELVGTSPLNSSPSTTQTLITPTQGLEDQTGNVTSTVLIDRFSKFPEPKAISMKDIARFLKLRAWHAQDHLPEAQAANVTIHQHDTDTFGWMTLDVIAPLIPDHDASDMSGGFYIKINKVTDARGHNMYDPKSIYERDESSGENRFTFSSLLVDGKKTSYVQASRNLSVREGARLSEVRRIDGTLIMNFPLDARAIVFSRNEIGKAKTMYGVTATLDTIEHDTSSSTYIGGSEIAHIHYKGSMGDLLMTVALNKDGKVLKRSLRETMINDVDDYILEYAFAGNVDTIKMYVYKKEFEKKIPFHLIRASALK